MKGSPATISMDLGVTAVSGCSLDARPPARIATTGMVSGDRASGNRKSRDKDAFIGHHFLQGSLYSLTAIQLRRPAQGADTRGVQPHHRHVALPAAVATGVNEARALTQTDGFHGHFCNFGNLYGLAGGYVEDFVAAGDLVAGEEHRLNHVRDVNVAFALHSVAEDA